MEFGILIRAAIKVEISFGILFAFPLGHQISLAGFYAQSSYTNL
jgi:hypothetical protein